MTVGSPGEIQVPTTYPGYPSSSTAYFQLGHPVFSNARKLKSIVQIYIECAHFHYHYLPMLLSLLYEEKNKYLYLYLYLYHFLHAHIELQGILSVL